MYWKSFSQAAANEEDIRQLLHQRANALMEKDLTRYLACFSPNYLRGTQTYADLEADASRWFAQFATIRFSFQILDMQIEESNTAIVENQYKFTVINHDGESIEIPQRELLELQRENNVWKIAQSLEIQ